MSDLLLDSLKNRIRTMNVFWQRLVADMTLDHVNHQERAGVLPIAFSLCHYIRNQDQTMSRWFLDRPPLWESGAWAQRIGVTVDRPGREETVAEMEQLRFADFEAWKAYQTQVVVATDGALEPLTEAMLTEVVFPMLPPNLQTIYCAVVVGPGNPVRKLEALECFVYQHGLRHMGEIEFARSLVGLSGLTS